MRFTALAMLALAAASPAAATVTISFTGATAQHAVSGSVRFDDTAAPSQVATLAGYSVGQFFPSAAAGFTLSAITDGLSLSSGYRGSVLDALPGNAGGFTDSFGAFVVAGGSGAQQYSFSVDYPTATALTGLAFPAMPPQGPATFSYSFAGVGYSIPVTWTAQAGVVPEPGSWALLIVGFGTAGAALRRRPARTARA